MELHGCENEGWIIYGITKNLTEGRIIFFALVLRGWNIYVDFITTSLLNEDLRKEMNIFVYIREQFFQNRKTVINTIIYSI